MNVQKALKRIVDYAHQTGIKFEQTGRYHHVKLGLPDCRGFTPHLRIVNLNKNQSVKKLLTPTHRWLLHDVLHIMFYDFADYHLSKAGVEPWADENRFLENHLASEAFAVLALDYHILSHTPKGGLAADIKKSDWPKFQKINPRLPDFLSNEFSELLVDLYLTGESPLLETKGDKKYQNWLGHEVRYSNKQRYYVKQWWNDLNNLNQNANAVIIKNSSVKHAVCELLDLFFNQPENMWKSWIKNIGKGPTNYFHQLPKYAQKPKTFDFRFTDISANALFFENLDGSSLFGLWQILSTLPPTKLVYPREIKLLSQSVQTNKPNLKAWNKLKTLSRAPRPQANLQKLACFFLP